MSYCFPPDSPAACPRRRRAHPKPVGASFHPAAQGGATVTVTAGGGRGRPAAGVGEWETPPPGHRPVTQGPARTDTEGKNYGSGMSTLSILGLWATKIIL